MQKLSKILTVRKENLALRSKICYTVWSMLTCFTTQNRNAEEDQANGKNKITPEKSLGDVLRRFFHRIYYMYFHRFDLRHPLRRRKFLLFSILRRA